MRKTLGAFSVVLAMASMPAIADPETASKLRTPLQLVNYSLPAADHDAVSTAEKGSPALAEAVGRSVATMTRTLVSRGDELMVIEVVPVLVNTLPEFAEQITDAAINNVPDTIKDAVRVAATSRVPAIGLGGITFPPPFSNPGNGGQPPTSPN